MADSLVIRSPQADDFENIARLANARFGDGYLERAEYACWLQHPTLFLMAEWDGEFAGYAYLMPEEREKLARALRLSPEYIQSVAGNQPVLHCRSAVLRKEMEHKVIMLALHERILAAAEAEGYGGAFAPAWKYNGYIPMGRLMQTLGFTYVGIRQMLWYDIPGYQCIVCGGRCVCDAAVYSLKLPRTMKTED